MILETQAQKEAAYNKVYPELVELAKSYIPTMFQFQVANALNSDAAKAKIHQVLNDAYAAAEAAK